MVRALKPSLLVFVILPLILGGDSPQKKEPVDYVDPNIGGIGQLLSATSPAVTMPYGMMRISPITTPGISDRYLADKIYGFPAAGVTLMPMTGAAETVPAKYASLYDHDLETATPYYYAAILEKYDVKVEYTASAHAAYYRITFPAGAAHVLLSVPQNGKLDAANTTLSGGSGGGRGRGGYFYAEFSKPLAAVQTLTGLRRRRARARGRGGRRQDHGGCLPGSEPADRHAHRLVQHQPGSGASESGARNSGVGLRSARSQARKTWNDALGKIEVKGGARSNAPSSTRPSTAC